MHTKVHRYKRLLCSAVETLLHEAAVVELATN